MVDVEKQRVTNVFLRGKDPPWFTTVAAPPFSAASASRAAYRSSIEYISRVEWSFCLSLLGGYFFVKTSKLYFRQSFLPTTTEKLEITNLPSTTSTEVYLNCINRLCNIRVQYTER
ncbi:uncharacterized protein LOC118450979 [Vespa mandarinia]|uniref:uncharacterized protein LOC118450979 n=1 Tax=Vespa mandarinia TaxID=7446 RepID=UPI0016194B62|nr:uncharacterized protein LOC118450979 [Vespa mandarinia]